MRGSLTQQQLNGFSFIELLITISIIGILSSIALVNLTSSWNRNRLVSTTRALENWLSEQRRNAMTQSLTYQICIDENSKVLFSSTSILPCDKITSNSKISTFNINKNFGNGYEKLELSSCTTENKKINALLFSHQGFSDHNLSVNELCDEESPKGDGVLELKLKHPSLEQQRCIKIISPIGMIRDGSTQDDPSRCQYDNSY